MRILILELPDRTLAQNVVDSPVLPRANEIIHYTKDGLEVSGTIQSIEHEFGSNPDKEVYVAYLIVQPT
jgi:hypothetical protein